MIQRQLSERIESKPFQGKAILVRGARQVGKTTLLNAMLEQISNEIPRNYYSWRTTQQQEVDYVEEVNGASYGYEFKWNERKKIRFPLTITINYKALFLVISKTWR